MLPLLFGSFSPDEIFESISVALITMFAMMLLVTKSDKIFQNKFERWIFNIQMSNIKLTTYQTDIRHSIVKHPPNHIQDRYSIFKCQTLN